jgi:hypothetical protein
MTNAQLFFALAGVLVTISGMLAGFIKYYLDAKIDPVQRNVQQLVDYMILHEGKIATLEERTKRL